MPLILSARLRLTIEATMNALPRIYLINLDKDTERLAYVSQQLHGLGLQFERVPAVYGTDMPEWLKPYFLDTQGNIASPLAPGQIGCYASHLMVLRTIVESGEPGAVLEDDIEITAALPAILANTEAFPGDWDIIRLSNTSKRPVFRSGLSIDGHHIIKFSNIPGSTGAYLVSPQGAHKFLTYRPHRSIPVDQELRRAWDHGLVTYGVRPCPVRPDAFGRSTIAALGTPGRWKVRPSLPTSVRRMLFEIRWLGMANWLRSQMARPQSGSQ
jgi:glycosyl transferase family 25